MKPSEAGRVAPSRGRSGLVAACLLGLGLAGVLWFALQGSSTGTDTPVSRPDAAQADGPTLDARGEPVAAAPAPLDAPRSAVREGPVVVVGRVVGAKLLPRGGVAVRVRATDRPDQTTRTAPDGRFELAFGERPKTRLHVSVVAVSGPSHAGSSSVHIDPAGPDLIDVGTITLRNSIDLAVEVMHAGEPVPGAQLYASSLRIPDARRAPAPWHGKPWSGWSHRAVSDAEGRAIFRRIPEGAIRILAVADGPLRGETRVRTDLIDATVVLELLKARDLRVEIVRKSDGTGIPGCVVEGLGSRRLLEEPWSRPVTDEHGIAIMHHAPNEAFELRIVGPDWCSLYLKMPRKVPAGVPSFRAEVPAPTRIRLPIEVADGPMPAEGTRVALAADSFALWPGTRAFLAREAVIEEGELVLETYYNLGPIRTLARLPDGRVGHIRLGPPKGPEADRGTLPTVVFRTARHVDVHITERGTGAPAVGVAVTLAVPPQGGNPVGPVRTDADGVAHLTGAAALAGTVNLCSNPDWVSLSRQGVFAPKAPVDLTDDDATVELQVEPLVDVVVAVRTNGKPRLPPGLEVLLFYWPQGVDGVHPGGLRLDPARGTLRFRARRPLTTPKSPLHLSYKPQRIRLRLTSTAYASETVTLAYDPATDRIAGRVDLVSAGSLITRVRRPKEGRFALQLERYDEATGWVRPWQGPLVRFAGESDQDRYERLRPGRYRMTETLAGVSSEEVQVHASPEPAVLDWDLGPVAYAEGTVVLPPGVDPKGLFVVAWTDTKPPRPAGRATMEGTAFKLRVPGAGPIRLYPVHPTCRPADDEGQVVISGPEQGLRLRMVLR